MNASLPFLVKEDNFENTNHNLLAALADIIRRAVDGTVVPLVIDYSNQRILIGASAAQTSGTNGKMEITGGDIRVVDAGKGLLLSSPNGTLYRLAVNNNGTLEVYPA